MQKRQWIYILRLLRNTRNSIQIEATSTIAEQGVSLIHVEGGLIDVKKRDRVEV